MSISNELQLYIVQAKSVPLIYSGNVSVHPFSHSSVSSRWVECPYTLQWAATFPQNALSLGELHPI